MTSKRSRSCLRELRQLEYTIEAMGLARVEGFLAATEIERLNGAVDDWSESFRARHGYTPMKYPFIDLDPDFFLEVMADELILALGTYFLGATFRFDNDVGIQQPAKILLEDGRFVDSEAGNLHGGPNAAQGSTAYFNGKPQCSMLNFGLVLKAQGSETGGFCYVPGSHRVGSPASQGRDITQLLDGGYVHQMLVVPRLAPGDLLIFNDGLVHGQTPWTESSSIRRTLYYRYTPGFAAWQPYEKIARYVAMAKTVEQQRLLRPPYVATFDEGPTINTHTYKSATSLVDERNEVARKEGTGR